MWVFAISKYIARENVQVKIYTHLLRSFFETLCCSGSAKSTPVVWNRLPSLYVRNNLITEVLPCLNGQVLKRLHTIQLLIIFFTLDLSCESNIHVLSLPSYWLHPLSAKAPPSRYSGWYLSILQYRRETLVHLPAGIPWKIHGDYPRANVSLDAGGRVRFRGRTRPLASKNEFRGRI